MADNRNWQRPRERRINNRAFVWVIVAIVVIAVAAFLLTHGFLNQDPSPATKPVPQAPNVPGGGQSDSG